MLLSASQVCASWSPSNFSSRYSIKWAVLTGQPVSMFSGSLYRNSKKRWVVNQGPVRMHWATHIKLSNWEQIKHKRRYSCLHIIRSHGVGSCGRWTPSQPQLLLIQFYQPPTLAFCPKTCHLMLQDGDQTISYKIILSRDKKGDKRLSSSSDYHFVEE